MTNFEKIPSNLPKKLKNFDLAIKNKLGNNLNKDNFDNNKKFNKDILKKENQEKIRKEKEKKIINIYYIYF